MAPLIDVDTDYINQIGSNMVVDDYEENTVDPPSCQLCCEFLQKSDVKFPIRCSTSSCDYNMCFSCIRNLLMSSQGYQTASDGNKFTIGLSCPNCRGDFATSVTDVIFLRRAETVASLCAISDTELSAAELREKYSWDKDLLTQLDLAEKNYNTKVSLTDRRSSSIWSILPNLSDKDSANFDEMDIDIHLFSGLEFCMTQDEQEYVNKLMTAGLNDKLAQAAQLLASIAQMNSDKIRNKITSDSESPYHSQDRTNVIYSVSRRNSNVDSDVSSPSNYSTSLNLRQRTVEKLRYGRSQHMKKLYPLPVRMPRAYTLTINFDPHSWLHSPITFANDDHSLAEFQKHDCNNISRIVEDAYSQLSVDIWNNVRKGKIEHSGGVKRILSDVTEKQERTHARSVIRKIASRPVTPTPLSQLRNSEIPSSRVVVAHVHGEPSRLGLRVGDVVTHVNGEAFHGSAERLRLIIHEAKENSFPGETPTIQIVVNAEVGTAEALRLRYLSYRPTQ